MRRSTAIMRLGSLLTLSVAIAFAHAHSLPDADGHITLELPEHNVELLAKRIEAVLIARGFTKVSAMPRLTLDGFKLPASASAEEGIVLSKFEKRSAISVFVQVTTCRASFLMFLADGTGGADGETQLRQTQEALVDGLSNRKDTPLVVINGASIADDPCSAAVRSNKSLERSLER